MAVPVMAMDIEISGDQNNGHAQGARCPPPILVTRIGQAQGAVYEVWSKRGLLFGCVNVRDQFLSKSYFTSLGQRQSWQEG